MVFSLGCPLLCGIGSLRSEIQEFAVKRIALQKQFRLQRDADRDLGKSITPTVCHMFRLLWLSEKLTGKVSLQVDASGRSQVTVQQTCEVPRNDCQTLRMYVAA